jgi:hypothetical protein
MSSDFAIKMDLSDAKVRSGGMTEVDPGAYKGKTTAVEVYNSGKSLKFTVDLGEAGECDLYPGLDVTKQGNRNGIITALASHGKNVEKIKAARDGFTLTPKFFVGVECYVLVTKIDGIDDQGRPLLNDKAFITKERFEVLVKSGAKPHRKADASAPAGNGAAPPAAGTPAAPAGTAAANLFD